MKLISSVCTSESVGWSFGIFIDMNGHLERPATAWNDHWKLWRKGPTGLLLFMYLVCLLTKEDQLLQRFTATFRFLSDLIWA